MSLDAGAGGARGRQAKTTRERRRAYRVGQVSSRDSLMAIGLPESCSRRERGGVERLRRGDAARAQPKVTAGFRPQHPFSLPESSRSHLSGSRTTCDDVKFSTGHAFRRELLRTRDPVLSCSGSVVSILVKQDLARVEQVQWIEGPLDGPHQSERPVAEFCLKVLPLGQAG